MATQLRKKPETKAVPASPENLLRALVDQLPEPSCEEAPHEEVMLDAVLDGDHYLLVRLPQAARPSVQLSPREQEIVRMVAQGHPNKIIADVLNISSWTVCTHLRRIFAKLGVGSRAAMVARVLENENGRGSGSEPVPRKSPSSEAAGPERPVAAQRHTG